ncbi:kelch-like protein 12 isoform 1-T1 [Glossina fuscipes fuscipes]
MHLLISNIFLYFTIRSETKANNCEQVDLKTYCNPNYDQTMLDSLNKLRLEEKHCDFILEVEGQSIYVHRVLIVIASPYFAAMLQHDVKENREGKVKFMDVKAPALKAIIEYIYSGKITITEESVESLIFTANLLQIDWVRHQCEQFLKSKVKLTNCFTIRRIATVHSCEEVLNHCDKYILIYFPRLINLDGFLHLPFEEFKALITHDDLYVQFEENVYRSVLKWIKHEPEARKFHLAELLGYINLPNIRSNFFHSHILTEPLFKHNIQCRGVSTDSGTDCSLDSFQSTRRTHQRYGTPHVVFVGGADKTWRPLKTCKMYDIYSGKVSTISPMREGRRNISIVSLHGFAYCTGGYNGERVLKTAERYDPIIDQWTQVTPMNYAHSDHGSCIYKDHVYVIGGDRNPSVEYYNPTTNKWYNCPDIPSKYFMGNQADVIGNSIYSLGDVQNRKVCINRFDPREGRWYKLDNNTEFVCHFGLVAYDHSLYCIGGWPQSRSNLCKRFNVRSNRWEMLSPINVGRWGQSALIIEKEIYLFGGKNGKSVTTVERYDIEQDEWIIEAAINIELFKGKAALTYHRSD